MRILYLTVAGLLLWVAAAVGCKRNDLIPTVPPPPTPTRTPTVTPTPIPHKVIFVTSSTYTAAELGSLANADALCTSQAAAAGYTSNFKAWLSGGGVNAIDRIVDVGPWYLVDQVNVVFANKAAMAGVPANTVQLDQYGSYLFDFPLIVWTGTSQGGNASGFDCSNWTAGGGTSGTIGNAAWVVSTQWTGWQATDCGGAYRMYCIEQ